MDYKKLLSALLSKAYKADKEKIDAILELNDEAAAQTALLSLDTERVASLKPKPGETFSDGHKKGRAEALENLENTIKETYGIETEEKGLDLIKLAVKKAEEGAGKTGDITDDQVRKHPLFADLSKKYKDAEKDYNTKLEEVKKGFTVEQTRTKAKEKALEIFESLNPILPADAKRAANQKLAFANTLNGFDFEFKEDGTIIINKDGKVALDAHGHNLDFEAMVKEKAGELFDFKANNGGGSPNNGGDNGGNSGPVKHFKPKMTTEEVNAIIDNKDIPAPEKEALYKAWEAENEAK